MKRCSECGEDYLELKNTTFVWAKTFARGKTIVLDGLDVLVCLCGPNPIVPGAGPLSAAISLTRPDDKLQIWQWGGFGRDGGNGWFRRMS